MDKRLLLFLVASLLVVALLLAACNEQSGEATKGLFAKKQISKTPQKPLQMPQKPTTTTAPAQCEFKTWYVCDGATAVTKQKNEKCVEYDYAREDCKPSGKVCQDGKCVVLSDTVPPGTVTELKVSSFTCNMLSWSWKNPSDTDFNHTEIYFDEVLKNSNYVAASWQESGLAENTDHTLKVIAVDNAGNKGIAVSNTNRTFCQGVY